MRSTPVAFGVEMFYLLLNMQMSNSLTGFDQ